MADRNLLFSILAFAVPAVRRRVSKKRTDPVVEAVAAIKALPVNFSPNDEERIRHAYYRLDAMTRHLDQSPSISEQRRGEFKNEARIHIANLMSSERMTQEEAQGFAREIGL